ncbi:hypothetical protein KSP40_PGU013457 [Platanthera guangdongensis]|uniref:USE1-like protein n=1 Tax=Platanthera guangdongensis TaxID=2320717 RepID=A0ABR2MGX2_9ASPA
MRSQFRINDPINESTTHLQKRIPHTWWSDLLRSQTYGQSPSQRVSAGSALRSNCMYWIHHVRPSWSPFHRISGLHRASTTPRQSSFCSYKATPLLGSLLTTLSSTLPYYVTTSRELLEQIEAEAATDGISRASASFWVLGGRIMMEDCRLDKYPKGAVDSRSGVQECSEEVGRCISKAKLNEYSEKIEALAARLSVPELEPVEIVEKTSMEEIVPVLENTESCIYPTQILRKRNVSATKVDDRNFESTEKDTGVDVKLDAEAHEHIEKHRKLQDGLTDEMVTLAKQLKESSLEMNKSLRETEEILDSTGKAVEQSLASTGHANTRAVKIYSESSKTSCFTWLIMFVMICIFIMVVLLIRIT